MNNWIKIGLVSVVFTTATAVLSQDEEDDRREKLEFGARAGLNISNVWDERGDEFTADSKFGFAGGLFVGIPIGKFLGVQPEVILSQKGFKGKGSFLSVPYSFKRTTSFIDIPLQLQLKPANFITFLFGPQFSYLIHQRDEYAFGSNSTILEEEFENDNIRKNILGFVAGTDIIYQNIVISGRVGWDFQNNKGDGTSVSPRYKNQWLQFTLGYKL
ncbi:MAG: PorT family protein [Crocinitomicaceae bacterium]|nr:PorT family protein [Crocinitomicaceae bacterium]